MGYKITGETIQLTRGDSFYCVVGLVSQEDKQPYTPVEGDVVRFALKRDILIPGGGEFVDQTPLLTKVIPNDTLLLHLLPSDTKNLHFGTYIYDVEIEFSDGEVATFIGPAPFILGKEVD